MEERKVAMCGFGRKQSLKPGISKKQVAQEAGNRLKIVVAILEIEDLSSVDIAVQMDIPLKDFDMLSKMKYKFGISIGPLRR